jgi:hypothetical protein
MVDKNSYYDACEFCNEKRCGGCPFTNSEETKVSDLLKKMNIEHNNTLFSNDRELNGKEV